MDIDMARARPSNGRAIACALYRRCAALKVISASPLCESKICCVNLQPALSATANALSRLAAWRPICEDGRGRAMSGGVQNSAPMGASAGELPGSAGHNPADHVGALGRGGLGTLIGAVVGVTTVRAHRLDHRVRKRCGKKEGEVRPTLIARAAGDRRSLTTGAGWWEEAMHVGGACTSARDESAKVPRVPNRGNSKQGQYLWRTQGFSALEWSSRAN